MKIWILSSETPQFVGGGIARYVDNFARLAGKNGHSVTVISRGCKDGIDEVAEGYRLVHFRDLDDKVHFPCDSHEPDAHPAWPFNNLSYYTALSWQYSERVLQLLRREGPPDVMECQDYGAIGYFVFLRRATGTREFEGFPIILHLHTPDYLTRMINQTPRYKIPGYWEGRMEKACIHMADRLLSPSRFLADAVAGGLEGPVAEPAIIPYPLMETQRELTTGSAGVDSRIVVPGRIELRKGVEPFLKACHLLWEEGRQFNLRMVGGDVITPFKGGSLKEYLENKYARWIGEGKLEFTGGLDHDKCMKEIEEAGIVAIPSLFENFPNACMEALQRGKLVIASKNGGQAEMIGKGGAAGLLFHPEKVRDIQRVILKAIQMDRETRIEKGTNAIRRISEFCSRKNILQRRIRHFEKAMEGKTKASSIFPFNNRRFREGPKARLSSNPFVSVVVPYYNLGEFVEEAVESALASEEVQLELLIVNDGTTDPASLEVLERIRSGEDPRVRILDIPNGGLANARNVGAKNANGELVCFLDADDRVHPDFIRRAVEVFRRWDNVHMVYSWVRFFGESRGIWHAWPFDLPYLLCHNLLIPIVVVRRESFLRHGKNKSHIIYGLEDYESWISMAEAGCGGVAIPETLVEYRIRETSMFRVIDNDKKLYLYDLIAEEHPELFKEYGKELFGLQNANGPAHYWDQPSAFLPPFEQIWDSLKRSKAANTAFEEEKDWLRKTITGLEQELDWFRRSNEQLKEAEEWLKAERRRLLKQLENPAQSV